METLDEIDNITKNIVREIVRDCSNAGVDVGIDFCIYYVKLLTIDPQWKISPSCKLNRENLCKFIDYCTANLQNPNLISIITLKMQYHFLKNATNRNQIIAINRDKLHNCLDPLLQEILDYNESDMNAFSQEKLFRKIIYYSTLRDGLGDPSNDWVFKESILALKSVLDTEEFENFIKLKRYEKLNMLVYYKKLVTGIRLFNHNNTKSVAEIKDLPSALMYAIKMSQTELKSEGSVIRKKILLIIDILKCNHQMILKQNEEYALKPVQNELVTSEFLRNMKAILRFCIQHKTCIEILLREINEIERTTNDLFRQYLDVMAKLSETTKYRVAIPIDQIYPLFIETSDIWHKIQNEAIVLSVYNETVRALHNMSEEVVIVQNFEIILACNSSLNICIRKLTTKKFIKLENCKFVENEKAKYFDRSLMQYLGYCPWYLVENEGSLVSGNLELGIIKWDGKYYAFSSSEAIEMFDKNPEKYVQQIFELARAIPELTNLFGIYNNLLELQEIEVLYKKPPEIILTSNKSLQTETHVPKENIDPEYMWNIWDLYRQAIKLANISQCKTHSSQTMKSYYRSSTRVQTYEHRDHIYQTKKDWYSNVPTLSNFIFGLRGRKDDIQHIIELTRPVNE